MHQLICVHFYAVSVSPVFLPYPKSSTSISTISLGVFTSASQAVSVPLALPCREPLDQHGHLLQEPHPGLTPSSVLLLKAEEPARKQP